MNAPNPTSGERDLEALRRAQRAHEPSMEEILASIRSIIADEREAPQPSKSAPAAAAGPQIVYSNPAMALNAAPAAQEPQRAMTAQGPAIVWDRAETAVIEPALEVQADADPDPALVEPLISEQTDETVSASFGALSATVAMHSAEMIEGLIREMLRPMLKNWLDDNLPSLVERLVRAEIQRVARGGR
jgi:cell pole-organizing protein PopZ